MAISGQKRLGALVSLGLRPHALTGKKWHVVSLFDNPTHLHEHASRSSLSTYRHALARGLLHSN